MLLRYLLLCFLADQLPLVVIKAYRQLMVLQIPAFYAQGSSVSVFILLVEKEHRVHSAYDPLGAIEPVEFVAVHGVQGRHPRLFP